MPRIDKELPKSLKSFFFHGMDLSWSDEQSQATGACPVCGKSGKFSANANTGLWDCKSCGENGNPLEFIRILWTNSNTETDQLQELANDRGLLYADTLKAWGTVRSLISGDWLVPGWSLGGSLHQLYRYTRILDGKEWKWRLLPTPGVHEDGNSHGLFAPVDCFPVKSKDKIETMYLCEGVWDGMSLWEVLKCSKMGLLGKLTAAKSKNDGLLKTAAVVATPGCNIFRTSWSKAFSDRRAIILFDNDHPRRHPKTGKLIEPASYTGVKKVTRTLAETDPPPSNVQYLAWGGDDNHDKDLPAGYDIKDAFNAEGLGNDETRREALLILLEKVRDAPDTWAKDSSLSLRKNATGLSCEPCVSYKELSAAWEKAMVWTKGLDKALSTMLACVTSTKQVGDQLWLKVVAPPSSGKSVLAEALAVNRQYVFPKDTMTGLFSGFAVDHSAKEDFSLASKINGKTLVIKDGDTLLQQPNKAQILSQFRALYDRSVRTSYGNRASRDYEGLSNTVIICGTSALRVIDQSELGERTLDCVIVEDMEDELEDEIGWQVATRVEQELSYEVDGKPDTREGPEITKAKQLTGGYIDYLRTNARHLLEKVKFSEGNMRYCQYLAKFVAYMRARPSARQLEKAERELSFRLISQHIRLAKCLAVVLNRDEVDETVLDRIREIALDTSRGTTMDIVKQLYDAEQDQLELSGPGGVIGLDAKALSIWTNETEGRERLLLKFLRKIGVVDTVSRKAGGRVSVAIRWKLTEKLKKLYETVVGIENKD